jgi:hypothetical protein
LGAERGLTLLRKKLSKMGSASASLIFTMVNKTLTSKHLVGATSEFANNEHEESHKCFFCKEHCPAWFTTKCKVDCEKESQWICDHCKEQADEYRKEAYEHSKEFAEKQEIENELDT